MLLSRRSALCSIAFTGCLPSTHDSSVREGSAFQPALAARRPGTTIKRGSTHLSRHRGAPRSLPASGRVRSPQDDMVWRGLCLLNTTIFSCLLVTQAVAAMVIASLLLEARFCMACWVRLLLGVRLRKAGCLQPICQRRPHICCCARLTSSPLFLLLMLVLIV